jgi:hypothetical protein
VEAFDRKIRSGDDPAASLIGAFWMAKSLMAREKNVGAACWIFLSSSPSWQRGVLETLSSWHTIHIPGELRLAA